MRGLLRRIRDRFILATPSSQDQVPTTAINTIYDQFQERQREHEKELERRLFARRRARTEVALMVVPHVGEDPPHRQLAAAVLQVAAAIDESDPPAMPPIGDVVLRVPTELVTRQFSARDSAPWVCTKGLPARCELVDARVTADGVLELWFHSRDGLYAYGERPKTIEVEFRSVIEQTPPAGGAP